MLAGNCGWCEGGVGVGARFAQSIPHKQSAVSGHAALQGRMAAYGMKKVFV